MASLIAGKMRRAVAARLQDPLYGFNANLLAIAGTVNIALDQIDFSPAARQFFQAYVDPDLMEDGTVFHYPLMLLYSIASDNRKQGQKYSEFAGVVGIGIEVIYSWTREDVDPTLFEDAADVVEAAMIATFNTNPPGVSWLPPCSAYGGEITCGRQSVKPSGEGLVQRVTFGMQARLIV